MRKINYFLSILFVFLIGCATTDNGSSSNSLEGSKWVGTIEGTSEEDYDLSRDSWTYTRNHVESAEFKFLIYEDRGRLYVEGTGTGTTDFKLIGECSGGNVLDSEFDVFGEIEENTGKLRLGFSFGYRGKNLYGDYVKKCPTEKCSTRNGIRSCEKGTYIKDDTFEVLFNSFSVLLEPESGASMEYIVEKVFRTPAKNYKVTINSILSSFSFDVDVDPPIITIKQGETAKANVDVKLLKGKAGNVKLTATKWTVLESFFNENPIKAGESTILNVRTSCDTPVSEYLVTAQGEVGFVSSVDAVKVIVEENPNC